MPRMGADDDSLANPKYLMLVINNKQLGLSDEVKTIFGSSTWARFRFWIKITINVLILRNGGSRFDSWEKHWRVFFFDFFKRIITLWRFVAEHGILEVEWIRIWSRLFLFYCWLWSQRKLVIVVEAHLKSWFFFLFKVELQTWRSLQWWLDRFFWLWTGGRRTFQLFYLHRTWSPSHYLSILLRRRRRSVGRVERTFLIKVGPTQKFGIFNYFRLFRFNFMLFDLLCLYTFKVANI